MLDVEVEHDYLDTMMERVCLEDLAFERSMMICRRPVEGMQIEVDGQTEQGDGVKDTAKVQVTEWTRKPTLVLVFGL